MGAAWDMGTVSNAVESAPGNDPEWSLAAGGGRGDGTGDNERGRGDRGGVWKGE